MKLTGAQGAEVLGGLRHDVAAEFHDDASRGLAADGDVEVALGFGPAVEHACMYNISGGEYSLSNFVWGFVVSFFRVSEYGYGGGGGGVMRGDGEMRYRGGTGSRPTPTLTRVPPPPTGLDSTTNTRSKNRIRTHTHLP